MGFADGRQVTICPDALRRAEARAKASEAALDETRKQLAELREAAGAFNQCVDAARDEGNGYLRLDWNKLDWERFWLTQDALEAALAAAAPEGGKTP